MATPVKILGLSGSLRRLSFNTSLLRAAQAIGDAGDDFRIDLATLHDIPLYDGDLEDAAGIPPAVDALKARIVAADALLIATPEYNNGIPGVLKNGIDWLSRPAKDIARIFGNRPVAVIGASPGGFGTILAQNHWLPVLKTLGTRQWAGGRLMVSRAGQVFDAGGALTDEAIRKQLGDFLHGYAQFVRDGR